MDDTRMATDDYVLWLKGLIDAIGDRLPTPEEWDKLRDQNVMQVGDVVMRRIEEREIAQRAKLEEARRAQEEERTLKAYQQHLSHLQGQQVMYAAKAAHYTNLAPGTITVVEGLYSDSIATTDAATGQKTLMEKLLGRK